ASLNTHKAHALALRAYCHYKLFAFFTPDYTNPNGLSVIKFDFLQTDDYTRFEKRSTVGEIVAFIESDIATARALVVTPDGKPGVLSVCWVLAGAGYASYAMMHAVLVRMYSMLQTSDAYAKFESAFAELVAEDQKALADVGTYLSVFGSSADAALTEGI